ncbi:Pta [Buchnera aphidicola str. G002 (Myzus persicae)]|uniref:Phosphate acetyltransferase n=1 Tax=Buchnera aphidicola str. USDA (Myzus persicae) TaxID=1009856 RepID=W0P0C4_BUCMP|nr:phosphate acetyltransferase [Buchnera aphidicola]AHG60196.1 Pta [Buchnera aphidicola str. USDA (Myzus persicae)]AHG60774.1 Pta [Buchnera aphidicola str. W106 (Myzus persicae)]AHG61346.1 Pta [Buchnera aphidicola str. G002 (Myzus persicae)]WAI03116.1 MAG: phosphate acetyltransferase [Buchnera aphidicola (Myzus persicae)]
MSRIIMLIPIDQDVALTTISLSMISFLNKHKCKNKFDKSILYFSCINDLLDDTKLIINKYFSKFVNILHGIDFSKSFFLSSEYCSLLNEVIEKCHYEKILYEFILIEGINYNHSIYSKEINYDIAQNLSAEVVLIANLKNNSFKTIKDKEQKIKLFLKKQRYKNILGVIFNNVYSPFIEKKYHFTKKLALLKKIKRTKKELFIRKEGFKDIFSLILAFIPWNKNLIKIQTIDIYNFLEIQFLRSLKNKTVIIKKIIIFDEFCLNMSNKKYVNTLIIVSFNRINLLIKMLYSNVNSNKISGIIVTETLKSKKHIISICQIFIEKKISIAFTKKNTIEILSQLLDFNFNINIKDKIYITKLQKYITSFFCYNSIMIPRKKNNNYMQYSPKEFCYHLKFLSRKIKKRIILPESYETRILQAVSICQKENIADCVLLGDSKKIYNIASDKGIDLSKNTEIINPVLVRNQYVSRLVELRKEKGMNESYAKKKLEENIVLATLILESNKVDGLVSGSINTTANTIRPALQLIKTHLKNSLVSSIFFMLLPNEVLIYADCAINVSPTAEELAEIAIQSADSSKIFGIEPRIAMLSYSTGYSGSGYQVEKVRKATSIVQNKRPDLIIDGPIQYDAAVSETVAKLKAPYSPILGAATIFIFPDLNSGNIAYKAVQRSANLLSIGPILQGLRKPVNDLSRGASIDDIVYTIALTSLQS